VFCRSEGRVRVGTGDDCTEQSSKASWWDAENPASLVVLCVQCVPLAECRIEALAASRTSYETTPHVSFATRNMRLRQSIRSFSDGAPERVPRRSSRIPIPWQPFNSSALDVVNASFAAHNVPREVHEFLELLQHIHIDAARTPCTPDVVIIASSELVSSPCYTQLGTACSTRLSRGSVLWLSRHGGTTAMAKVEFLSYGCAADLVLEVMLHGTVASRVVVVPSVEHSDLKYLHRRPILF